TLGTSYLINSNGTHFVFDTSLDEYKGSLIAFRLIAKDNSGNLGSSLVQIDIPKRTSGFTFITIILPAIFISSWIIYKKRKKS
ncbi:MAG: hypothetical protein ACXAAM_06975, partial [Candidatus Heimdallarchaeaceae archaeon]